MTLFLVIQDMQQSPGVTRLFLPALGFANPPGCPL